MKSVLIALLTVPALVVGRSGAQGAVPPASASAAQRPFRIADTAQDALRRLWESSIAAKAERVACLGGTVDHDVVYITRVEALAPAHADSANISASASLRACAPPTWFGTVHTHIATFQGNPYPLFSAPDRYVMRLWMERWKQHGVFCILFTDKDANCEYGYTLSARLQYVPAHHATGTS